MPYARTLASGLLLVGIAVPLNGQTPVTSPRALGVGSVAYDAVSCGPEALSGNPAGLARGCRGPSRLIVLPTVVVEGVGDGPGSVIWDHRSEFMDLLTAGSGSEAGVSAEFSEALLADIPASGVRHRESFALPLAQFPLGDRTAIGITYGAWSSGHVSRDLIDLVVNGVEDGRLSYDITPTEQELLVYWTAGVGHGRTIGPVDVGAQVKLLGGTMLGGWRVLEPQVDVVNQQATVTLAGAFAGGELFRSDLMDIRRPDGFGWGLDVGAITDLGPLRVSAALENLAGAFSWNEGAELKGMVVDATMDTVQTRFEEGRYDPDTADPGVTSLVEYLHTGSTFPRTARLAAAWETRLGFIAGGAAHVYGGGRLTRAWDRRYELGGEIRPLGFLALRAGVATDLASASAYTAGVGVRVWSVRFDAFGSRVNEGAGVRGYRFGAGFAVGR